MITDELKDKMKELVVVNDIRMELLYNRFYSNKVDYDWYRKLLDDLTMTMMELEDEIEKAMKS